MTTRRLLVGILAWPVASATGTGVPTEDMPPEPPVFIDTGTVLQFVSADGPTVTVRFAGRLYRVPAAFLSDAADGPIVSMQYAGRLYRVPASFLSDAI